MKEETQYIVILQSVVGNFEIAYEWDFEAFKTLKQAIKHGFTLDRSDDFNIGIIRDGHLVQLNWMEKNIDEELEVLKEIEKHIDLAGNLPITKKEE
jgi:hypothetical protein